MSGALSAVMWTVAAFAAAYSITEIAYAILTTIPARPRRALKGSNPRRSGGG